MVEIEEIDGGYFIRTRDFILEQTLDSGQVFRYEKLGQGHFSLISGEKYVDLVQREDGVLFSDLEEGDIRDYWIPYFDLDRDYREIKDSLSEGDPLMKKATDYGSGIRIMKQDKFETLISFIVSANNHIPRIKKILNSLSDLYGEEKESPSGRVYKAFPKAEVLAGLDPKELRERCKTGFRDVRIVEAAERYPKDLEGIDEDISTKDLRDLLMSFNGVGPKVSDCILLFAYYRTEVFPVDVWIKRVVEEIYLGGKETPKKEVERFAREKFGDLSGFAQQYLFYYGRDNKIGK